MIKLKHIIILYLFFIIIGCKSSINYNKDYVIIVDGFGDTQVEAQKDALLNLTNSIFVSVKNLFSSYETLQNDQFVKSIKNNLVLESAGYLKNFDFINVKEIKGNKYSLKIALTKEAIKDNIRYLDSQIQLNNIDTMAKYLLVEQRKKLNFLIAFIGYAKSNGIIVVEESHMNELFDTLHKLNLKLDSAAKINFIISPINIPNVVINMNNNTYEPYNDIYLNTGSYSYKIEAPGYLTNSGIMDIREKDEKILKIYLHKKLDKKIPVLLLLKNSTTINNDDLNKILVDIIINHQVNISSDAKIKIEVSFGEILSNGVAKNFYNINLPVMFMIYDNSNNVLYSKSFNITYINNKEDKNIPINFIQSKLSENINIFFA